MTHRNAADESYKSHAEEWARQSEDLQRREVLASWLRTDTADYWRHARMYEAARAFTHKPDARWLTVGDGRFGLDSIRLRALGFVSVLPSDIGDALLKESRNQGLIGDYAIENAEALSFEDDSFDLVFCKESYHHFPRPPVALYEMLRVAKDAVVLIEPRDYVIDHGPTIALGPVGLLKAFYAWLRYRARLKDPILPVRQRHLTGDQPSYEESGNYLYTISSRELEKVALGINLPAVAFKGLNDSYVAGGETEPADAKSSLFRIMKGSISEADVRSKAGRGSTGMLMAILFKATPDQETKEFLDRNDWLYLELPRNPHS